MRTEFLYGAPGSPFRVTASRTGGVLTQYFYDHSGLLIALERGGARFYVGTDQVGTPRVVTDANGAVVKTFATNAFGVRDKAAETGTFELALGFAGGIEDPVTGLVRFGLRDYEPATGRFTAKDPILHEGGMNLFVYAGNNPVSQRDPSGMDEVDPSLLTLPTPGERIVGHFNKFVEWIKSEDGRDTIENIAEIPSENQAIKSVEMLDKGLSAVDFAEDAMAVYEAESQNISLAGAGGRVDQVRPRDRRRRTADPAHAGWSSSKRRWTRCCRTRGTCATRAQATTACNASSKRSGWTGEPAMMRRIAHAHRGLHGPRLRHGHGGRLHLHGRRAAPGPRRRTGRRCTSRRPVTRPSSRPASR